MQKFTNCIVPDTGHRNSDGYVRVWDKPQTQGGRLTMLHRLEYEKVFGKIPKGYEIDHRCKNRECCNVNHLEMLTSSVHRAKDSGLRHLERTVKILKFCKENPNLSQKKVADLFGVSQATISYIVNSYNLK